MVFLGGIRVFENVAARVEDFSRQALKNQNPRYVFKMNINYLIFNLYYHMFIITDLVFWNTKVLCKSHIFQLITMSPKQFILFYLYSLCPHGLNFGISKGGRVGESQSCCFGKLGPQAMTLRVMENSCLWKPSWMIWPQILIMIVLSDSVTQFIPSNLNVLTLDIWGLVTMSSL